MECDSCGFYVHEGCYGLSDTDSKMSEVSNASTEPWFCNSCLLHDLAEVEFNLTKRSVHECELCPNVECGLLKETETGKFVHILCALYVPGVAFQSTDKLWPVVLDEIPYQRWGDQTCSLCEDVRFSRTGVCIRCDAGLCKTSFHVTCAQAHGYLVDPEQQNENEPFLAYCKQHLDTSIIRSRKTNYLAMISDFKSKLSKDGKRNCFKNETNERFLTKLKNARENYLLDKMKIQKPNVSEQKIQRMISTCPSALKMLFAKNALSNEDTTTDQHHHHHHSHFGNFKTARFTSDYVKYFFEREKKMPHYFKTLIELKETQKRLTTQENDLRIIYDNKLKKRDDAKKAHNENLELLKNVSKILNKITLKKSAESIESFVSKNKCDLFIKEEPVELNLKKELNLSKQQQRKTRYIDKISLDALCVSCEKKGNAHLLIDCDTCKKYYHINCLSPPLNSVPKKTKLFGWECSNCCHLKDSDRSDIDVSIDLDTPRSLRRKAKIRSFH